MAQQQEIILADNLSLPSTKALGDMFQLKEITYTVDMFRSTLKLLVETPKNPFIAPATLKFIHPFLKIIGYQGNVDKVGNVIVRGMLIDFLTYDIRATQEYKEYEKVFVRKKKRKQVAGKTNSPSKSLKVIIKQNKPSTTPIPPPSDDKERDETKVQEKLMEKDIEKMVDGEDEESYASGFADSVFPNEEEDSSTRLEPGVHRENPKTVDDDDDVMCKRQGFMIKQMEKKYVTNREFWNVHERVDKVLHEVIPQIASRATDDLIERNLKRVVANTVIQERDALQAEVPALISKEFANHAPQIMEELFKIHMKNNVIQVHPTTSASSSTTSTADLQ
ncbi:hypothetical protein Tco_0410228 [Tanacetum coccineum]